MSRHELQIFPPPNVTNDRPQHLRIEYREHSLVAAERPNKFTIMARIQDEDSYMTPSPSVVSNPDPNLPELTFGLSDSSSDDDNVLEDAV